MPEINIQNLLLAGCHFGHITRRWNPKMKKYIFMERNGIHIIDLNKTAQLLTQATDEVSRITRQGGTILFVGTKKQAKDIIKIEANRCGMPYVTERWLGGTLTNFITIKKSIKRLKNLEKKATDGTYDMVSKKEILTIEREKEKLERVLGGIRDMAHLPESLYLVDAKKEDIAIREANRLGIPVIAILDTNCDPDLVDFPIPSNDDAFKAINLITHTIAEAVIEGKAGQTEFSAAVQKEGNEKEVSESGKKYKEEEYATDEEIRTELRDQ
ncbi:30S ribosomal protein S2 [candidate division KSB1 bacterium RBG_16_48_16]|nr:MAG: 30S ribosomal protein S2 [candidate division KSB1 bacterium RBG_16_48_16]